MATVSEQQHGVLGWEEIALLPTQTERTNELVKWYSYYQTKQPASLKHMLTVHFELLLLLLETGVETLADGPRKAIDYRKNTAATIYWSQRLDGTNCAKLLQRANQTPDGDPRREVIDMFLSSHCHEISTAAALLKTNVFEELAEKCSIEDLLAWVSGALQQHYHGNPKSGLGREFKKLANYPDFLRAQQKGWSIKRSLTPISRNPPELVALLGILFPKEEILANVNATEAALTEQFINDRFPALWELHQLLDWVPENSPVPIDRSIQRQLQFWKNKKTLAAWGLKINNRNRRTDVSNPESETVFDFKSQGTICTVKVEGKGFPKLIWFHESGSIKPMLTGFINQFGQGILVQNLSAKTVAILAKTLRIDLIELQIDTNFEKLLAIESDVCRLRSIVIQNKEKAQELAFDSLLSDRRNVPWPQVAKWWHQLPDSSKTEQRKQHVHHRAKADETYFTIQDPNVNHLKELVAAAQEILPNFEAYSSTLPRLL